MIFHLNQMSSNITTDSKHNSTNTVLVFSDNFTYCLASNIHSGAVLSFISEPCYEYNQVN